MAFHATAGTTRRIRVKDLAHLTTGPVTTGAVVTFRVIRLNTDGTATVMSTATGVAEGDDWYTDVTVPAVPAAGATYVVNAKAVASGATEEFEVDLLVKAARP